jgi:hypothetical protein
VDGISAAGAWRGRHGQSAYRPELPTNDAVGAARAFQAALRQAEEAGDDALIRDARAMIERMDRQSTRIGALPAGPEIPSPSGCGGSAAPLWVAAVAERISGCSYLRQRFPDLAIAVMTGQRPPSTFPRPRLRHGAYPETIAVWRVAGTADRSPRRAD